MSRRLTAILIAGAVVTTGLLYVAVYVPWPGQHSVTVTGSVWASTTAAVALAFFAAGLVAWRHWPTTRIGLLFTVVGFTFVVPAILSNLHNSLAFTVGNVAQPFYSAPLIQLGLEWPSGRLRAQLERGLVAVAYCWVVGYNVIGTLFWNPRTNGCSASCPANLMLVDGSNSVHNAINDAAVPVSVGIGILVLGLVVRHRRLAAGWTRRATTPLVWIVAALVAEGVVQGIGNLTALPVSGFVLNEIVDVTLLAGPALVVISLTRTHRAIAAVGRALVGLSPAPAPDRLREALAGALGDPALELALRQPSASAERYRDTKGRLVDPGHPPEGRAITPLDSRGDALLVFDGSLVHEPELMGVFVSVATLALEQSRLQAEVASQLEQVRASRARLVEAGDAARRRLERDLHDGAQQRLVTLSLALSTARARAEGLDPELKSLLETASKEAREALVELRELARGIHPTVLTETGLAGAVQALVERSVVVTTIEAVPGERFPAPVEATAYFVVAEALANVAKHAPSASARVAVRRVVDRLEVEVSDDGGGGAAIESGSGLRGLEDRVASVGGSLRIHSPRGHGTRVEAVIPCL